MGVMESTVDEARQRAREYFDAADFGLCLQAAQDGLSVASDDVELLVFAGRAGVEVDADDAVEHLRRATEVASGDANTWHYLGEALAAEGSNEAAEEAFRRAVALEPEDQIALTHLGHTSVASGRREEGLGYLARAADLTHGASTAVISLVDMYRSFGQFEEALAQAQRLVDAAPDDPLAWFDVADLSLALDRLDEAERAFERLRELDDVPGHEAFPLYGMIQVEGRRERWDRARQLAAQVAAIDPVGLSTDLMAFVQEHVGEATDQAAPSLSEIEAALGSSLATYRLMLADDAASAGAI